MPNTQNKHDRKNFKECGSVVRIPDVELFPPETTLTWEISEPNESVVRELFERRFDLCFDQTIMSIRSFRVLSKARFGIERYSSSWIAEMQYLRDFDVPQQNMRFRKDGIYYFHGSFTFWRVNGAWKARIC